jgi:uncharacterized protein YbaA (DUF1428 family)
MSYVDGFVLAVPTARREEYRAHAAQFAGIIREHGALSVMECWGDDVPEGKLTSFTMAVKREADETVVFSWVSWPSKDIRDTAWKAIMADPRMPQPGSSDMPFDGKRMIFGGFNVLLEA